MKSALRWLIAPFILGLMLVVAYFPLPIPPHLDFLALYHANLGVLRGVPLYDLTGQVNLIAEMAHVPTEQVNLLPFVYPPWYALLTLPLALLSISVAARFWFMVNLLSITVFVWLLTDGRSVQYRFIAFLLAILFLPVLGALYVGQFVFPVLLGAGILVYTLPRERVGLASFGLFLLTFKPHIGGLVLLAVIVHLLLKRDTFARCTLWTFGAIMAFFFAASFLVDRAWPLHYLETLFGFRDVSPCEGICISLPMEIMSLFGMDFSQAVWVAGILLLGWISLFIGGRPKAWKDTGVLIAIGFCITLLSSPYQYNYDFVVLLLPLFVLASKMRNMRGWLLLALAYILPWVGLFFARQGNQVLLISAIGLMYLLWNKSEGNQSLSNFVSLTRDTK